MKYIPIGRILSTHGVNGEVKFRYYNEVKEDFSSYTSLFVQQDCQYRELKLSRARIHKELFLLLLEGLDSPEKARFLANKEVFVREDALPALDDGAYYDYQLIGLSVLNDHNEEAGRVSAVLHRHGMDFLVVIDGGEERFLPMLDDHIAEINIAQGYVRTTATV